MSDMSFEESVIKVEQLAYSLTTKVAFLHPSLNFDSSNYPDPSSLKDDDFIFLTGKSFEKFLNSWEELKKNFFGEFSEEISEYSTDNDFPWWNLTNELLKSKPSSWGKKLFDELMEITEADCSVLNDKDEVEIFVPDWKFMSVEFALQMIKSEVVQAGMKVMLKTC